MTPTRANSKTQIVPSPLNLQWRCQLQISTKGICQLRVAGRPAADLEHGWRGNNDTNTFCSRCRDIQSVEAVQEFHPTGCICIARSSHRIDNEWCLLSLELVHRANAGTRNSVSQLEDLRVVRRDDQDARQHPSSQIESDF